MARKLVQQLKIPMITCLTRRPIDIMHEILFQYLEINSREKLTDDERCAVAEAFSYKRLRKRQYFLQQGDVCKCTGFIVSGSARMYSIDEKGHEHIIRFGLESSWLSDQESMINLTPSSYYIEMLEDSELLVITFPKALALRHKSRCFELSIDALEDSQFIAIQKRILSAISMSAEEKYRNLECTNPEFLERFPMNMIASYLGLSPETLSRIRKTGVLS